MKFAYRIIALLLVCFPLVMHAEVPELRAVHPQELSIGWGDMIAETALFHESAHRDYTLMPVSFRGTEKRSYRYTGHVVLAYQYRANSWFGAGFKGDVSAFMWEEHIFRGGSMTPLSVTPQHCYNIALLPEAWITWYHHYWFDVYSSLGVGLAVNGGTETDTKGRHVAFGGAGDITVIGISVGNNQVFGSFEAGGLIGMKDTNHIFLLGARLLTLSVGVRF